MPQRFGQHDLHRAGRRVAAAGRVQALMVGEHALTPRVTAWTMATQARLGMVDQARASLAALDDRQAAVGEIRNAALPADEPHPARDRRRSR
jgi:LuxR family maltose regulon positive regulatory protein